MAYNIEKTKQSLDSISNAPEKYSPITAKIKKEEEKENLYWVVFSDNGGIIKHTESNLTLEESFSLADGATLYLKSKGYACNVDLTDLPEDFKMNALQAVSQYI